MISYNADSGNLYGSLGFYPAKDHPAGTKREIWDWDGSFYLGTIPEVNHTYNVVGNVNEHGLIIGETTFGGLPELDGHGSSAIMDYGSLIWVTLQRTKTAREAIHYMDHLCQTYGYASDGESFSIADTNEVWLMELIGKGKEKGAVWVANRVPDGYVGSTANQARTRTFALNDPENVLYAKDVITFAQSKGLYPKNAKPEDFSFADVYDPPTFTGVRLGDARVWNLFNQLRPGMEQWLDYAKGYNLSNPMPLFVKPESKVSLNDTMWYMRTHFEGTWFDNTGVKRKDVGAGSGNSPYRWRPLVWSVGGDSYINERTIGVQQTAWNFVAQSRGYLPPSVGTVIWFTPDDSSTTVRVPFYAGITDIPSSFADPVGQDPNAAVAHGVKADAYKMSFDSIFWVNQMVSNLAYGERYNVLYPLIQKKIRQVEEALFKDVEGIDKRLAAFLSKNDVTAATKLMTDFCVRTGDQVTKTWLNFWMELFSTVRDGFTVSPSKKRQCVPGSGKYDNCVSRLDPNTATPGYSKSWYERIVADSNNKAHYHVPKTHASESRKDYEAWKMLRMQKRR